ARTARGRQLTPSAWRHLGIEPPAPAAGGPGDGADPRRQPGFFDW
ncbi:MAG: Holliday junction branch migration DNA helicase RuvB, partial [Chloroflexota bacterium]|nr:Holliday junction branch migration DNA helicase RuvB [Chloroflexota bacterium]